MSFSENLKVGISAKGSFAIAINGVVGAGIFALPGILNSKVGALSPFCFLVAGFIFLPIAFSLGRLATQFEITGGPVAYTRKAFGPIVGFQIGWIYFLASTAAQAANTHVLVSYLATAYQPLNSGVPRILAVMVFWTALTILNVVGVGRILRAVNVITLLKLTPLLVLIGWGIKSVHLTPLTTVGLPDHSVLYQAIFLSLYSFVGFEGALVPAAETKNAQRTIPSAVLWSILSSAIFYFLIQLVYVSNIAGGHEVKQPLSELGQLFFGPVGAILITFTACFSIAGNLTAGAVTLPRLPYALAVAGDLPSLFSTVHKIYRTPWLSIAFTSAMIAVLACTGNFVSLAKMAVLGKFVVYGVSIATLIRFENWKAILRIPGFALLVCFLVITQVKVEAWTTMLVLLGAGVFSYGVHRAFKAEKTNHSTHLPIAIATAGPSEDRSLGSLGSLG